MANHASARTTHRYDSRREELNEDDAERILIENQIGRDAGDTHTVGNVWFQYFCGIVPVPICDMLGAVLLFPDRHESLPATGGFLAKFVTLNWPHL